MLAYKLFNVKYFLNALYFPSLGTIGSTPWYVSQTELRRKIQSSNDHCFTHHKGSEKPCIQRGSDLSDERLNEKGHADQTWCHPKISPYGGNQFTGRKRSLIACDEQAACLFANVLIDQCHQVIQEHRETGIIRFARGAGEYFLKPIQALGSHYPSLRGHIPAVVARWPL